MLGGSGFKGAPCGAETQHGFKGVEKEVMNVIQDIIKNKKTNKTEIN